MKKKKLLPSLKKIRTLVLQYDVLLSPAYLLDFDYYKINIIRGYYKLSTVPVYKNNMYVSLSYDANRALYL